jgi:hypothetical protein
MKNQADVDNEGTRDREIEGIPDFDTYNPPLNSPAGDDNKFI